MVSASTRALLAEVAGTFWFCFVGAGAIVADAAGSGGGLVAISAAHGVALAVAISAFGALSGGHFNPAVTFGLAVAGRHPWSKVPTYWVAQIVGGLIAGFALLWVFSGTEAAITKSHLGTPALAATVTTAVAIGLEAILTIFLVWAVYGTAVSRLAPRIAGFGIGLTVATDILVGGPLTGAAMNPARWLATAVPAGYFNDWYVYIVGPLVGAAIAAVTIRYVFAGGEAAEVAARA